MRGRFAFGTYQKRLATSTHVRRLPKGTTTAARETGELDDDARRRFAVYALPMLGRIRRGPHDPQAR
jgi:hypothetical protein